MASTVSLCSARAARPASIRLVAFATRSRRLDRLLQELRRRAAQCGDRVVHRRVPGEHGDRQAGRQLAHPLEQLEPVHAGQLDVGDQQVPLVRVHPGERAPPRPAAGSTSKPPEVSTRRRYSP